MKRLVCLFGLLCCGSTLIAAPLDAAPLDVVEQRMVAAVDERRSEAEALLETLVNINSGTMHLAGVRADGARLRTEFESIGFETSWVSGDAFERAGHLVARHRGNSSSPVLLLIGHMDTVFEPPSPFQHYEKLSHDVAKGPGIADMKGGNVIMLEALTALNSAGQLSKMNIIVVITGDEEKSGRPESLTAVPHKNVSICAPPRKLPRRQYPP